MVLEKRDTEGPHHSPYELSVLNDYFTIVTVCIICVIYQSSLIINSFFHFADLVQNLT